MQVQEAASRVYQAVCTAASTTVHWIGRAWTYIVNAATSFCSKVVELATPLFQSMKGFVVRHPVAFTVAGGALLTGIVGLALVKLCSKPQQQNPQTV